MRFPLVAKEMPYGLFTKNGCASELALVPAVGYRRCPRPLSIISLCIVDSELKIPTHVTPISESVLFPRS